MIGIIGGTGLYALDGLQIRETKDVHTPFGSPSAPLSIGRYEGADVAFLPRHGLHHTILPSEINYRANIWALKSVGVRQVLSASAVGSLAQEIPPGDLALPDQYLDLTKGRRQASFFGDGVVAHISSAKPACPMLSAVVMRASESLGVKTHPGVAYACVEGPRLGTRAESFFLRGTGAKLVGMTNVPEVFLAREAQLCYVTIAISTDYDCWHEDPNEHASLEKILALYRETLGKVKKVLSRVLTAPMDPACSCRSALKEAIVTSPEHMSEEKRRMVAFLKE